MANGETLGASFSIDVTNLKAGLAQANRLIRESESEFKAAAAGMDDWSNTSEGLEAKIKSLSSITDIQKKKVNALQSEYDRLVENGLDPTSKEAVELRTKINQETAALNKNEAEAKKLKASLEDLKNGTEDSGEAAEKSSEGFTVLKGAMANLLSSGIQAIASGVSNMVSSFFGLAESTREARNSMAKLQTSFETAGHSATSAEHTFAELYGILGDEGTATEASQQLAKFAKDEESLAASTRILTGVMAEYGDSIPTEGLAEGMAASAAMGSVQGVLADALEWQGVNLDKYNAKLATLRTEEERAAYIQQTLTDLYGESADAYLKNNESIIMAQKAQAEYNAVMNEMGAILEPVMTHLKMLSTEILDSMMPFVSLLGEGLAGALQGSAGAADLLAEGLTGIVSTVLEMATSALPAIIETVTAIVPMLLTEILGQLPTILETLMQMLAQVISAIGGMLPQLIPTIINAVVMMAETLIDNIDLIIDAGIALILGLADGLLEAIPQLIDKIPVIIDKLIAAILKNLPKLLEAGIKLVLKLADGLIKAIPQLLESIPVIIENLLSAITDNLPQLVEAGIDFTLMLAEGLIEALPQLLEQIPTLIEKVTTAIHNNLPKLVEAGVRLTIKLGEGLINAIPQLTAKIPQIVTAIDNGLSKALTSVFTIGQDIVRGLWNGINDKAAWIGEKIRSFCSNALDAIKAFFGIKSPSRVMADVVGKNLALGIGKGFEENIDGVNDTITKAMDFTSTPLTVNAKGKSAGAGGGVVVNQTNYYAQSHSRYELYKTKQNTAAAVRLAMGA